jgi:hypothetical protein
LPVTAVILMSGSNEAYKSSTRVCNPLNAESTIIRARVPTPIPATEIQEIILITLCDFLDIKYRFAM